MKRTLFVGALVFLVVCSCVPRKKYIYDEGFIYGTLYHIVYESPNGKDLHDGILKELNRVGHSLSTFDSTSVISLVNQNKEVTLDRDFLLVYNRSMEISGLTNGAFDITVAPMVNIWGFGFKNKEQISAELIDSMKTIVGYQKLRLENNQIIKEHPNSMLDCSAIAKGYSCDVVGKFLKEQGCENYMVEIGGEVVAAGRNKEGEVWSIGIAAPVDDLSGANQSYQDILRLPNRALATSGNYRNFYVEGGKKYAHTIDPHTGYPVQHSLLSATVLADNCMTADALATSFMVMGLDSSKELIPKLERIDVYFIYADQEGNMKTYATDGFKELLVNEWMGLNEN